MILVLTQETSTDSAGQCRDWQELSELEDANDESVEELAESGQYLESEIDGVEGAADHPERPVHTHEEDGNPEDVPPQRRQDTDFLRRKKTA